MTAGPSAGAALARREGMLAARAPAKVNLTLHVLGRRADGYHDLDSLVAFAGCGDGLTLDPAGEFSLSVAGPTAARAGPQADNLVLRAAAALAGRVAGLRTGAFALRKRLPVAAGLGGGSADAAAALRLLARLNGLGLDDPRLREAARLTGADVPVCLEPQARLMRGTGAEVGPRLALPRLFCVLVNPGVGLATAAVFSALRLSPGEAHAAPPTPLPQPLGGDALLAWLRAARNDLEPPAMALAPAVGEARALLAACRGCRLARMSGSGATTFGLFDDCAAAAAAAAAVRGARPGWWVKATSLR